MTPGSLVRAARTAPTALSDAYRMAAVMKDRRSGPEEACTVVHLFQEGFSEAQVIGLRDPARRLMQGLPSGLNPCPPGRIRAKIMLKRVPEIRARIAARAAERARAETTAGTPRTWAAPVVRERLS